MFDMLSEREFFIGVAALVVVCIVVAWESRPLDAQQQAEVEETPTTTIPYTLIFDHDGVRVYKIFTDKFLYISNKGGITD